MDKFDYEFTREKYTAFKEVISHIAHSGHNTELMRSLYEKGVDKVFVAMAWEISGEAHKHNWCDEPNCRMKQGTK